MDRSSGQRKCLRLGVYGAVFLALIGSWWICSPGKAAQAAAPAPVLSASEIDYPPFCIVDAGGQPGGFSVELMRAALAASPDEFLASHFDLRFMYRHDSSVLDPDHAFPRAILAAAADAGAPLRVSGMTASCDAWFYNNWLGIPTVVYGPGALKHAHTKDEQITGVEIGGAAKVLAGVVGRWC